LSTGLGRLWGGWRRWGQLCGKAGLGCGGLLISRGRRGFSGRFGALCWGSGRRPVGFRFPDAGAVSPGSAALVDGGCWWALEQLHPIGPPAWLSFELLPPNRLAQAVSPDRRVSPCRLIDLSELLLSEARSSLCRPVRLGEIVVVRVVAVRPARASRCRASRCGASGCGASGRRASGPRWARKFDHTSRAIYSAALMTSAS
jgi:hypothetical protein